MHRSEKGNHWVEPGPAPTGSLALMSCARLPAGGQATPATYWSAKSRRQFVVIAAGGHPAFRSGSADTLMAFALPEVD